MGRSRVFLALLTPHYFDSPWCMLELLAAVLQNPADPPIVFVKVGGYSMTDVGFPSKLEAMGFPHAAQLRSIKYEKLNRDYWDASIGGRIADRIDTVRQSRPAPVPAVSQADVDREFELLRQRRNKAFPTLQQW